MSFEDPIGNIMQTEAEMQKKKHVYLEKEKARYTTHWDMDYLPLGRLKALYRLQSSMPPGKSGAVKASYSLRLKRRIGWVLIGAGIVLLGIVALVGR